MELLFWKTSREASEIIEGYGTQKASDKKKSSYWREEDEETLERVFHQLKEAQERCDPEELRNNDEDLLDSITVHFTAIGKDRRQVAKKLKDAVITSSPEPMPRPRKASTKASVPLLQPTAWRLFTLAANASSNCLISAPPMYCPLRNTRKTASSSSDPRSAS